MEIAVLGWGSLIWSPGSLRLRTLWHDDGPEFPIEFARKSQDKRLTLVICPNVHSLKRVYWALSEFDQLEDARQNLQEREGTPKGLIHSTSDSQAANSTILETVRKWAESKPSVTAAIWTGLETAKEWRQLSEADLAIQALSYVQGLEGLADTRENTFETPRLKFRRVSVQS